MRVILAGRARDRARVRRDLSADSIEIVAEFETLAEARAARVQVDALIVAEDLTTRDGLLPDAETGAVEALTSREVEVLELLTEGFPNKRIAEHLGISDQTVKFHISAISSKLGAANRTDIVRRAARGGLITL